jgi:hypothetical protein
LRASAGAEQACQELRSLLSCADGMLKLLEKWAELEMFVDERH